MRFFGFAKDTDYTINAPGDPVEIALVAWDVNKDVVVNILDLILVARDLDKTNTADSRTDINGDGKRNILDLTIVARHLGEAPGAAPPAVSINRELSPVMVRAWIARAQVKSDGSLVFPEGIANLRRLLASLIPERTALLANYPNPFNSETWVPSKRNICGCDSAYLRCQRCFSSDVSVRASVCWHFRDSES